MSDVPDPVPPAPAAASAQAEPAPTPAKKPRKWLRRTAWALAALAVLVVLAPFALSIAPIRRFVAEKVSDRVGRRVTIGGLSARWWSGIEARDVEVHNPDGFDGPPLLAIDRIEAHVGVIGALTGDLHASLRRPTA